MATDALLGDHLARRIADRLNAFVAPTVRIGCSEHHLGFPGTLSVSDGTFHRIVADVVRSLARGGFRHIVLLPTHGGNFGPLAAALEKLGPVEGVAISALTDLDAFPLRWHSSGSTHTVSHWVKAGFTPGNGKRRC